MPATPRSFCPQPARESPPITARGVPDRRRARRGRIRGARGGAPRVAPTRRICFPRSGRNVIGTPDGVAATDRV